jgi:hypothetical protein
MLVSGTAPAETVPWYIRLWMVSSVLLFAKRRSQEKRVLRVRGRSAACQSLQWITSGEKPIRWQASMAAHISVRKRRCSSSSAV